MKKKNRVKKVGLKAAIASFSAMTALGLVLQAPVASAIAGEMTKQNVILLMSDDYGDISFALSNPETDAADDSNATPISAMYPEAAPIPNLASLAKEGVRFMNGWAMPACTTTRGARTTGLYPSTTGIGFALGPDPGSPRVVPPGTMPDGTNSPHPRVIVGETSPIMIEPLAPTDIAPYELLQKLAQEHGYMTGKYGKAHETSYNLLDDDAGVDDIINSGFDTFYGNMFGFPRLGFGGINGPWDLHTNIVGEYPTTEFVASAIVSRAIQFIIEADKHFLLLVDFPEPHWIGGPNRQYEVAPGPDEPCPVDFEASGYFTCEDDWYPYLLNETDHAGVIAQVKAAFYHENDPDGIPWGGRYPLAGTRSTLGRATNESCSLTPNTLCEDQHIAAFKSKIAYHDMQIGRLMEYVNPKTTTTIYTGDNGTQGGNGNVTEPPTDPAKAKSTLYRAGVEVPFLAWGKGVKGNKRGRVSNALISTTDIFATVLNKLGIEQPKASKKSSFDFSAVLSGNKKNSQRKFHVAEFYSATPIMGSAGGNPNPGAGQVLADKNGFRLIIRGLVEDRAFVCKDEWTNPAEDCYNALTGEYEKVYTLEFYDTKKDPEEVNPLGQADLKGRVKKAFQKLCKEANRIAESAVFHHVGTVCMEDGSQLPAAPSCDTDKATVWVLSLPNTGVNIIMGGPDDGEIYIPGVTTLRGTKNSDVIVGTDGPDIIRGGGSHDGICGRGGNDVIYGDNGDDNLFGGDGDDTLHGGKGHDELHGGKGNDTLNGNAGHDELFGGSDIDTANGNNGWDFCTDSETVNTCEE